jgi:hypothetical protein
MGRSSRRKAENRQARRTANVCSSCSKPVLDFPPGALRCRSCVFAARLAAHRGVAWAVHRWPTPAAYQDFLAAWETVDATVVDSMG